jgi:alkaline phosphatase
MHKKVVSVMMVVVLLTASLAVAGFPAPSSAHHTPKAVPAVRNVIFFHPDGYGLSHWNSLRFWLKGPDGKINWDKLAYMAPYTEHMKDALTASSHGGATTHAYGVKVVRDSFGMDGHQEITALSGKKMSIMEEAMKAGFATALVQTGHISEPGTAAFVASVKDRRMEEEIAKQVIGSRVDVILAGGERWLLPEGLTGRHGKGARKDGLNLIEKAEKLGYTVVYTRDELIEVRGKATKVLGVFASEHSFHDMREEELRAKGLPLYVPGSPTIAEMSEAVLKILSRNPKAAEKGIFIVAEEEGTDNFGNVANARGSFEAGRRADEAFGVFVDFVAKNPNTLLITAADSSAGGKHILGEDPDGMKRHVVDGGVTEADINSGQDGKYVKAPLDGIDGANTEPFLAVADKEGERLPFAITWATRHDLSGGIVARAKGLNAKKVTKLGVVDNTDIYRIMYYTLFGKWLDKPVAKARSQLLGRAIIPADAFVVGPTSGQHIGPGPFFGRVPPFRDKQPVQGISAILYQGDGTFLAMSDNGFGSKANSPDYLLAVYRIRPNFNDGSVKILETIRLRDPNRQINFPIVNEGTAARYLTGADFDIESLQIAPDGTFWFGDEFGPFLFQTDAQGVVLSAPIPLADVKSPDSPFLGGEKATLPRSGGFEGMAISVDGSKLYPMLERALTDDKDQRRRIIYEFDLKAREFTGRKFFYQVESAGHAIGELIAIDKDRFLVIERDGKQGVKTRFKDIFKIDTARLDKDGYVHKQLVADLLRIADPNLISLRGREEGDIGLGETFSFPFVTIEAVTIIDPNTLVVTNDNNFPFSDWGAGRNPDHPDDTEIIKIRLATPLRR